MPNWLGLPEAEFDLMMQTPFPGFDRAQIVNPSRLVSPQRWDEMDDLRKLLSENRTGLSLSEIWMVDILVVRPRSPAPYIGNTKSVYIKP